MNLLEFLQQWWSQLNIVEATIVFLLVVGLTIFTCIMLVIALYTIGVRTAFPWEGSENHGRK